jgi:PEGA domain
MHARYDFSRYLPLFLVIFILVSPHLFAGNDVMGEIQFEGKTKVEKTSGVWIDGQYVGYLKELKGAKKVLLLPGDHTISVRQNGYADFTQQITIHPGEKRVVAVAMQKGAAGAMPTSWAIVKIVVNPGRAAVFLDDRFVGHVGEFDGPGQSLQVAPGVHKIKIALPGYTTFETEINPIANQKVEVKTDLAKSDQPLADPSLKGETPATSAPSPGSVHQR